MIHNDLYSASAGKTEFYTEPNHFLKENFVNFVDGKCEWGREMKATGCATTCADSIKSPLSNIGSDLIDFTCDFLSAKWE